MLSQGCNKMEVDQIMTVNLATGNAKSRQWHLMIFKFHCHNRSEPEKAPYASKRVPRDCCDIYVYVFKARLSV